jgi:hypothetical protein
MIVPRDFHSCSRHKVYCTLSPRDERDRLLDQREIGAVIIRVGAVDRHPGFPDDPVRYLKRN